MLSKKQKTFPFRFKEPYAAVFCFQTAVKRSRFMSIRLEFADSPKPQEGQLTAEPPPTLATEGGASCTIGNPKRAYPTGNFPHLRPSPL